MVQSYYNCGVTSPLLPLSGPQFSHLRNEQLCQCQEAFGIRAHQSASAILLGAQLGVGL